MYTGINAVPTTPLFWIGQPYPEFYGTQRAHRVNRQRLGLLMVANPTSQDTQCSPVIVGHQHWIIPLAPRAMPQPSVPRSKTSPNGHPVHSHLRRRIRRCLPWSFYAPQSVDKLRSEESTNCPTPVLSVIYRLVFEQYLVGFVVSCVLRRYYRLSTDWCLSNFPPDTPDIKNGAP